MFLIKTYNHVPQDLKKEKRINISPNITPQIYIYIYMYIMCLYRIVHDELVSIQLREQATPTELEVILINLLSC